MLNSELLTEVEILRCMLVPESGCLGFAEYVA